MTQSVGEVYNIWNATRKITKFKASLKLSTLVRLPFEDRPGALGVSVAFVHELLEWIPHFRLSEQITYRG
jgi:hypothetical protein